MQSSLKLSEHAAITGSWDYYMNNSTQMTTIIINHENSLYFYSSQTASHRMTRHQSTLLTLRHNIDTDRHQYHVSILAYRRRLYLLCYIMKTLAIPEMKRQTDFFFFLLSVSCMWFQCRKIMRKGIHISHHTHLKNVMLLNSE